MSITLICYGALVIFGILLILTTKVTIKCIREKNASGALLGFLLAWMIAGGMYWICSIYNNIITKGIYNIWRKK